MVAVIYQHFSSSDGYVIVNPHAGRYSANL